MPYWLVVVEGRLPPGGPLQAEGFFTHRYVRAADAVEAGEQATSLILAEWLKHYVEHPRNLPDLRIDQVSRSNWWRAMRSSNRGHTFY